MFACPPGDAPLLDGPIISSLNRVGLRVFPWPSFNFTVLMEEKARRGEVSVMHLLYFGLFRLLSMSAFLVFVCTYLHIYLSIYHSGCLYLQPSPHRINSLSLFIYLSIHPKRLSVVPSRQTIQSNNNSLIHSITRLINASHHLPSSHQPRGVSHKKVSHNDCLPSPPSLPPFPLRTHTLHLSQTKLGATTALPTPGLNPHAIGEGVCVLASFPSHLLSFLSSLPLPPSSPFSRVAE